MSHGITCRCALSWEDEASFLSFYHHWFHPPIPPQEQFSPSGSCTCLFFFYPTAGFFRWLCRFLNNTNFLYCSTNNLVLSPFMVLSSMSCPCFQLFTATVNYLLLLPKYNFSNRTSFLKAQLVYSATSHVPCALQIGPLPFLHLSCPPFPHPPWKTSMLAAGPILEWSATFVLSHTCSQSICKCRQRSRLWLFLSVSINPAQVQGAASFSRSKYKCLLAVLFPFSASLSHYSV